MRNSDPAYERDLHERFVNTWKKLTHRGTSPSSGPMEESVHSLFHNLRWTTAYGFLHTECAPVLAPYHPTSASLIIKQFWIEYMEQERLLLPPTPQEFFEWYCDSNVIEEERSRCSIA